jgi:hypothetical protein
MSKRIQAYFRTENDAADVTSKLHKYHASKVEMGALTDVMSLNRDSVLLPFAIGTTTTGTGIFTTGQGVPAGVSGAAAVVGLDDVQDSLQSDNFDNLSHTLSAEISDEDYIRVVHMIRENHGYVELL